MKLLIVTQVYENYGAHTWDGTGECPQYWKAKGSCDYVVKNFNGYTHPSIAESARAMVDRVSTEIECNDEYFREHIIDWKVVADDYLTEFERDQLEYDGKIMFPAKVLEFV